MSDQLKLSIQLRNEVKRSSPHAYGGGFVSLDKIRELIAQGADINCRQDNPTVADDSTPLIIAVRAQDIDIIRVLLEAGADTEARCFFGTPLLMAAQSGNLAIVEALIENGANINALCYTHHTALMHAAKAGHDSIVHFLLAQGADVSPTTPGGDTALELAESSGKQDAARAIRSRMDIVRAERKREIISQIAQDLSLHRTLRVKPARIRHQKPRR